MPEYKRKTIQILAALLAMFILNVTNAQVSQNSELFKIIETRDRQLFEAGFNQCDMKKIDTLLPEKFEFYHDRDGITTSKKAFIKTLVDNLCRSGTNTTKRTLDDGSMEVFALYNDGQLYGAIQTGTHHFGNTSARFTNLWLHENEEWKPSRIMSYEHKLDDAPIITDISFIKLSRDEMSSYIGHYEFSPEFVLTIVMDGSKLYGEAQGQKVELKPYGNHRFLDHNQRMTLEFLVTENGIVEGLTMSGPSGELNAKKIKL